MLIYTKRHYKFQKRKNLLSSTPLGPFDELFKPEFAHIFSKKPAEYRI